MTKMQDGKAWRRARRHLQRRRRHEAFASGAAFRSTRVLCVLIGVAISILLGCQVVSERPADLPVRISR